MRIPKWFFYLFYTVALVIAFLYFLFPSKPLERYVAFKFSQLNPGWRLTAAAVAPALPPGIRLKSARFYWHDTLVASADVLDVHPRWRTLLFATPRYRFAGRGAGGRVEGEFSLSDTRNPGALELEWEARLADLHVDAVPIIHAALDFQPGGRLSGRIAHNGGRRPVSTAHLTLAGCQLPLKGGGAPSRLMLDEVTVEISAAKGRALVKRCEFSGPRLEGGLSGNLTHRRPIAGSLLNLRGGVRIAPGLLPPENAAETAAASGRTAPKERQFRIRGSLAKPEFQLR